MTLKYKKPNGKPYFTTSDCHEFTNDIVDGKIKQKEKSELNPKLAALTTKSESKAEQDKIVKLEAFD